MSSGSYGRRDRLVANERETLEAVLDDLRECNVIEGLSDASEPSWHIDRDTTIEDVLRDHEARRGGLLLT